MLAADEVTGDRWGEAGGWVKFAGFVLFHNRRKQDWKDGTDTVHGSSLSFDGKDLGCFSSAATVSPGRVSTHSQDCLGTLASSIEVGAFFSTRVAGYLHLNPMRIPWDAEKATQHGPIMQFSSCPFNSLCLKNIQT